MATTSEPLYDRHSGHIGPLGPVLMVVFGTVCAVVLGAVYGGACGAAVGFAAKVAKVTR